MTFAQVPAVLRELAAWIGAIVVIVSGVTLIFTRKPFKWVARKLVAEPFGQWVQGRVEDGTKDIRHLTEYHLGPNGTTPPIHRRIAVLEVRALVDSFDDLEED